MTGTTRKRKGFTLIELMVSLIIMVFVGLSLYGVFRYFQIVTAKASSSTRTLKSAEKVIAYLKKDLSFAIGIEDAPASVSSPHTTVWPVIPSNSGQSICVVVPAIHVDLSIVDDDGVSNYVELGTYTDHFYYWLENNQLKRLTVRNTGDDNPYDNTSPRVHNEVFIVAENIQSLSFTYDGVHTIDTYGGTLSDLDSVYVSLTASVPAAMGRTVEKSLQTKIKFRNH